MSIREWAGNRSSSLLKSAFIAAGALGGGFFILKEPSLTWFAAVFAGGGILALGLAVGTLRRVLLVALAFLLPFYIHKGLFVRTDQVGEVASLQVAVVDVVVLLLAFLWLADMAVDRRLKVYLYPAVTVPLAVWLLMSAFSIPGAPDPQAGLFQLKHIVMLVVTCLVVANQVRDERDSRGILAALILGLFCQSTVSFYQALTGRSLGLAFLGETSTVVEFALDVGQVVRTKGLFGHPNSFAVYLEMVLPLAFVGLFAARGALGKALAGLVWGLGVAAMVLTLSRGGWLGFAFGLAVVAFFLVRRRAVRFARGVVPAVVLLLVLLLVAASGTTGLVSSRLRSGDEGALVSRFPLMRGAVAMIADHPVRGVGLGNYGLLTPEYNLDEFRRWGPKASHVHNIFLAIGAEVGLVGLAAFVWALGAILWRGVGFVRRVPVGLHWLIGLAVLAALSAVLLHNQGDYALLSTPALDALFWFMVGWLMAVSRISGREARSEDVET